MPTLDPETKRKGIERAVMATVAIIGLAVAAPIIYLALEGAIALAALGAVGLVLWGVAPVLAMKVANKRISLMIAEAEANPIETMQNLYADKQAEFQRQEDAVTEFDTQFRNVSSLVEDLKKSDPDEAVQYAEMRDQMEAGLKELRNEQASAQAELLNAKNAIAKMQRIWKVANAMNRALMASASAQAQVFAQMKNDAAVDAVKTNLNRAFARLNTAVERRRNGSMLPTAKTQAALPEAKPNVSIIDLGNVKATSNVHLHE